MLLKKEKISLVLCSLVLWILCLYNVKNLQGLHSLPDAYGYWASAAFFSNIDWKELTSYNPYYSYGYGIILSLLFKLNIDYITRYRAAIILNCIFLQLIFVVINRILVYFRVSKNLNNVYIAFILTIYPYNIIFSNESLPEELLVLVYWIIIFLVICYLKTENIFFLLMVNFFAFYSYAVHQRTIVLLATVFILDIFLLYRKHSLKYIVIILLTVGLCAFLVIYVKTEYKTEWFNNANNMYEGRNDYGAVLNTFGDVLQFKNVRSIFFSILGKSFYMLFASNFMAFFSIIATFKSIKECILTHKISDKAIIVIFVNIVFWLGFAVDVYFNWYADTRLDRLIYGRYIDNYLGPFLLIGFLFFVYDKYERNFIFLLFFISILLIKAVSFRIEETNAFDYYGMSNSVAIMDSFNKNSGIVFAFLIIKTIIIILALESKRITGNSKLYLCVTVGFMFITIFVANEFILDSRSTYSEQEIINYINDANPNDVYYYMGNSKSVKYLIHVDAVQYGITEIPIKLFNDVNISDDSVEYIMVHNVHENMLNLADYEKVVEGVNLDLYKSK